MIIKNQVLSAVLVIAGFSGMQVLAAVVYDPPRGEGRYILTPPAEDKPVINGTALFGVRPGSPFLYTIPATGKRPMKFSVSGLPDGLSVHAGNGQINGKIRSEEKKTYEVVLVAENASGKAAKKFRIVVGETICLTPPLGWSSWNAYYGKVTQEKVLLCARSMVEKGLINYGWTYINVDDVWQDKRGGKYNAIQPNSKFPDIQAMVEEIHSLGLKAGIYSSPWVMTYGGCVGGSANNPEGKWEFPGGQELSNEERKPFRKCGQYYFIENDVKQWAEWGFDYLKYDWWPNDEKNTNDMSEALKKSGRDIVYSLSPRGITARKTMYMEHANVWRTGNDINDSWDSIRKCWDSQKTWADCAAPGHFPDADMLVVDGCNERNSNLTPDEQYTHVSLWSLWSSPLIIGSHFPKMTDFAFSLLTNAEVLCIQQDELCKMARQTDLSPDTFLFVKTLHDGNRALGLTNTSETQTIVKATWEQIGVQGPQNVRDVWRQKDVGVFDKDFSAVVPAHGTLLLKLAPTN